MVCRNIVASLLSIVFAGTVLGQTSTWSNREIEFQVARVEENPSPVLSGIAVQPGKRVLATAGDDHDVQLWNADNGAHLASLSGHQDWVRATVFSPTRPELASSGNDHLIILWNLTDNQEKKRIAIDFAVAALAYSPDGLHLAAVGYSRDLLLITLDSEVPTAHLECPCRDMRALAFSPDGNLVAAGGRNGTVQIWDLKSQKVVDSADTHRGRVRALAFTANSDRLISCGDDRRLCIRQNDGQQWNTLTLPRCPAKLLAFTLVEGHIVVGGTDNQIRLWDLETYEETAVLSGHRGSVCTLQSTNDGFVSGSFDTSLRLWTRTSNVSK